MEASILEASQLVNEILLEYFEMLCSVPMEAVPLPHLPGHSTPGFHFHLGQIGHSP